VIVCESFMTLRPFTEAIGHCLFKNFSVKSVYFFLQNILPLYATGIDTGIVIEMGF
jgi:actin-related protein